MAINVNTVYQTVLLILNKEQRGYMTPDEFNKVGTQVQREIFEKYFNDLNQQVRVPQTNMDYADRVANLDEKIAEFKTENVQANPVDEKTITGTNPFTVPSELYRLGSITYEPNSSVYNEIQRVDRNDFYLLRKSRLTNPTDTFPVYLYEDNKATIHPSTINTAASIKMQYVKKPTDIRWGYSIGNLGQYIYDPTVYNTAVLNTGVGTLTSSITTQSINATQNSYTGKPGTTTGFTTNSTSGSGLNIKVTIGSGGTATSVDIITAGTGFLAGETITIEDSVIGGTGPLVITLVASNFNANSTYGSTNFELHNSEQTEAILKILLYAGIVIRDPQIIQVAAQQAQKEEINEKS
jgi:hypothetical protein